MELQRRSERTRAPVKSYLDDELLDDIFESSSLSIARSNNSHHDRKSHETTFASKRPLTDDPDNLVPIKRPREKSVEGCKVPVKPHNSSRKRVIVDITSDMDTSSEEEELEQSSDSSNEVPRPKHSSSRKYSKNDGSQKVNVNSYQADEDIDDIKIQKIIACRTDCLQNWKIRCETIHTSEIDYGSRWFQDEGDDPQTIEKRYLVKWADLSYLHCSWETEKDLLEQVENAKSYLSTFARKSKDGCIFNIDERGDGEYFDPRFLTVERILDIIPPDVNQRDSRSKKLNKKSFDKGDNWGLILEKGNPDYEYGLGRQLLIKWAEVPYSELTYEYERDLIVNQVEFEEQVEAYLRYSLKPDKSTMTRNYRSNEKESRNLYKIFGEGCKRLESAIEQYTKDVENMEFPNGGRLRDYQAEGVTWLLANYINNQNSILADEMGLGKTIQTAVFVHLLSSALAVRGPFLVIAPLSTLPHWQRAFSTWTHLNTVLYHGTADDRKLMREHEFAFPSDRPKRLGYNQSFLKACHQRSCPKWQKTWMVQVVLTTPEILCADDSIELATLEWEALIVDEAHRLKNHSSKFGTSLRDERFTFKHILLLTGTPIQNNMNELWSLMNLIDPRQFPDCESFMSEYGDMKTKEKVDELHETIRPYILRRLKEDVEKSVPLKEETLIEVELTVLQKQYYRALYEKNIQFLQRNSNKATMEVGPSLNNIAMQLRKCCNHPFLLEGVEQETRDSLGKRLSDSKAEADFLVQASGKLVLLDKLLPKLKEGGHRVLIFSQFKIMLDILEDYLRLRKFKADRIDGSITGRERQKAIDRFQSQGSMDSSFVMLLTTRAGGVGINLTAADTVIIYDSDFNPQNDLQAQARCHRIGQTKSVKVYRLLTRKSYEMQMFHMSSLKMGLDQAVLQGLESGCNLGMLSKDDVEKLLRCGAYDVFRDDRSGLLDQELNKFMEEDIETILERRSKTVIHDCLRDSDSETLNPGSTFSKASFRSVHGASGNELESALDIDIDDPDFWKKVVGVSSCASPTAAFSSSRRTNCVPNYCLGLSDNDDTSSASSTTEYSQRDSITSECSELIFDSGLNLKNNTESKDQFLRYIQRSCSLVERRKWGGPSNIDWEKKDVSLILNHLQRFGYRSDWTNLIPQLSKDYDAEEVKRMRWSICLLMIVESSDEELRNVYDDKADSDVDKMQGGVMCDDDELSKSYGISLQTNYRASTNGSEDTFSAPLEPLRIVDDNVENQNTGLKRFMERSSWTEQVLKDAVAYASSNAAVSARSDGRRLYFKLVQSSLVDAFDTILLPTLYAQGWTKEFCNGKLFLRSPGDGDDYKMFSSITQALQDMPKLYPGLNQLVANVVARIKVSIKYGSSDTALIQTNILDRKSLNEYLTKYAPLQLLEDRRKKTKISFNRRKFLTVLSQLHQIERLCSLASMDSGKRTDLRLAELITIKTKACLPYRHWTKVHDANLILAIFKHGWIEQDNVMGSIMADENFIWANGQALSESEKYANELEAVRLRALSFLNAEASLIEKLKAFRLKRVLQAYNIIEETNFQGARAFLFKNVEASSELNGSIPCRKALIKRAKSIEWISANNSVIPARLEIDKSDIRNVYIYELLQTFTKLSKNQADEGLKLLQYALFDADMRSDDIVMKALSETLRDVILDFANLPASKVDAIRAVLAITLPLNATQKRPFFSSASKALMPIDANKASSKPASTMPLPLIIPPDEECLNSENYHGKVDPQKHPKGNLSQNTQTLSAACVILNHLMSASTKTDIEVTPKDPDILRLSYADLLLLAIVSSRGIPLHSSGARGMEKPIFYLTWSSLDLAFSKAFEKSGKSKDMDLNKYRSPCSVEKPVLNILRSMRSLTGPFTLQMKWICSHFASQSDELLNPAYSYASLDKNHHRSIEVRAKDCCVILSQIVQQTLLRHIFLSNDLSIIKESMKNNFVPTLEWPFGWTFEDDFKLSRDILFFGYSHISRVLLAINERKCSSSLDILKCSDAQDRINWITNSLFENLICSSTVIDLSQHSINLSHELIDLSQEDDD